MSDNTCNIFGRTSHNAAILLLMVGLHVLPIGLEPLTTVVKIVSRDLHSSCLMPWMSNGPLNYAGQFNCFLQSIYYFKFSFFHDLIGCITMPAYNAIHFRINS